MTLSPNATAPATPVEPIPDPVDAVRPLRRTALFGLQHVLVMAATPISSVFLVSGTLGLDRDLTLNLLATSLVLSGIGSILQSWGLGPFGPRLPFVMLPGGAPVVLFIGIAQAHGLPTASGAVILTGVFYFVALPLFTRLLKFFPPIVIGTMIVIVGINLVKVGAQLIFGRPGQPQFGDLSNITLGLGTIGITVLIFLCSTGMMRRVAVMLGLIGGTVLGLAMGKVSFAPVADAGLFHAPTLLPFGSPVFNLAAAVPLLIFSLASMAEAAGQTVINGAAVGRKVDLRRDAARTIRGDAAVSTLGGFLGMPLMVTSGENVGIVRITGVRSRFVTVAAGVILIVTGLFAPISAAINAVPPAVVGGTAVVVFAVIVVLGVQMLARSDLHDQTNTFVVAVSLGLGLLPILVANPYGALPDNLRILLESGVAVGAISAAVLNGLFRHGPWNREKAAPAGADVDERSDEVSRGH
jgi:uracil-xanthine permease